MILRYNKDIYFYTASKELWQIIDSYQAKESLTMRKILEQIAKENELPIGRTIEDMIDEWRVHNMFYTLHLLREKTKTVDLESNQNKLLKFAYKYLSKLYWFN